MPKKTDSTHKLLDQMRMSRRYKDVLSDISLGRHGLEKWRNLALDWIDTLKTDTDAHVQAVKVLLTDYILKNGLSTSPKDLYDSRLAKPEYTVNKSDWREVQVYNYICQFLNWSFSRRIRPSLLGDEVQFYKSPIFRSHRSKKLVADRERFLASQLSDPLRVDELFGALTEKDAKFATWISLAKEWFCTVPAEKRGISLDALQRFFVSYLLEHKVVEKPRQFFLLKTSDELPLISSVFRFSAAGDLDRFVQLNAFLDWTLISCRLSQETHGNPFSSSRLGARSRTRIADDKDLLYLSRLDPLMEDWRRLAAEWLSLITYFVIDAGLPIQVVSKLIAGHSRILMTLYYTKAGISYVNEVLAEAERKAFDKAAESERHFLRDRTYESVASRYAYLSEDAPSAYVSQPSAASTIFEDKGICPVAGQFCDVGGPPATATKVKTRFLPVPGYPKRNCVRCRFFLTGPAFLPGLVAHFNKLSYDVNNASERYARLDAIVRELENERFSYQQEDEYFPKTGELERVQQRYEAQAEQLNQLVLDMQHCHRLVTKSVELGRAEMVDSKLQLATNGTIADLGFALKETQSEIHQIEVVCENAVFYPEIDARQAVLRRSHLLDLMFDLNGRAPIFYKLNEEQQHIAGNAVMKLIKARAGSLDSAVEFVEGHRQLAELGLVGGDFDSVLQGVSGKEALKALTYDFEAGTIGDSAGERSDAS